MKNIFNLVFAIVVTLGLSMTSFARNPAAGDDPNATMSSLPEAGTMVLGADTTAQKGVCVNCQNRNNLKLSDTKDNYQPGMAVPTGTTQPSGSGQGNK
jgi:hypothetical protein